MKSSDESDIKSPEIENNNLSESADNYNDFILQKATPEYLQELLRDKKQLQTMPNTFKHVELILEKEIALVRERLFHKNGSILKTDTELPEPSGAIVALQRKVFVPVKENPSYNFVGRLLGPRGFTAKQMEQDLGCKIMVRGKGSMRDKRKEDQNRGKPNWEHLQEELHVLVSVEDYENRAEQRLDRAVNAIQDFLDQGLKTPEDKDLLKQTQLMELAVLNDKDRQQAQVQQLSQQQQQQQQLLLQHQYLSLMNNPSALAAAAAANQNSQMLAPLRLQSAINQLSNLVNPACPLLLSNSLLPSLSNASGILPLPGANTGASVAMALTNSQFPLPQSAPFGLQQMQNTQMLPSLASSQVATSLSGYSTDQLTALLSAANSLNSHGLDSQSYQLTLSAAASSSNIPFFSSGNLNTSTNRDLSNSAIFGDYAQSDIDGGAGKLKSNNVPNMRMHPYLRQ